MGIFNIKGVGGTLYSAIIRGDGPMVVSFTTVLVLVFIVMSFSSADPARLALGESATPDALEQYRVAHHLNDPLLKRFWEYLLGLIHGDLGTSFTGVKITGMVADAFPITLQLTFIGIFVAVIVATVLGITAALYRDKWQDQVIRVISIACLATPSFWLALLLIQWFSDIPGGTGTFPALVSEWVPFSEDPGTYLNQIFLPALAIAVPTAGSLTRVVRTAMVEELDRDYVRTAIGGGIPKNIRGGPPRGGPHPLTCRRMPYQPNQPGRQPHGRRQCRI